MNLTWKTEPSPATCGMSDVVEHGLKDGKGRSIGNYALVEPCTVRHERVPGQWQYNRVEVPLHYVVTTQATRDGKTFGAISTGGTHVDTLDEAKALAAKKIAAAGKRFARQVAKGEGKQFAPKATS